MKKGLQVDLETTEWLHHCSEVWVQGALRAGLRVGNNTMNTRRCVALFVTLGFAHEKPTHL